MLLVLMMPITYSFRLKEVVVPKDSWIQIKKDLETQKTELEAQTTKTKSQIVANLSKVTEFIADKESAKEAGAVDEAIVE